MTRLALADVAGHGESVAHVSEWLLEALRTHRDKADGEAVLEMLNASARQWGLEAMSTAVVVTVTPDGPTATVAYAGHPPVLIYRRGRGAWDTVDNRRPRKGLNLTLGIFENAEFTPRHLDLAAGDRLFAYTDGLLEAPHPATGESYGLVQLRESLGRHAALPLSELKGAILDDVSEWAGGNLTSDDVTLVAVEVGG
ncbi:MAG: PP2C family protein-serine/threonine phosphatase [Sumerlaeia bacterium]